jgi:hypothetical protein
MAPAPAAVRPGSLTFALAERLVRRYPVTDTLARRALRSTHLRILASSLTPAVWHGESFTGAPAARTHPKGFIAWARSRCAPIWTSVGFSFVCLPLRASTDPAMSGSEWAVARELSPLPPLFFFLFEFRTHTSARRMRRTGSLIAAKRFHFPPVMASRLPNALDRPEIERYRWM